MAAAIGGWGGAARAEAPATTSPFAPGAISVELVSQGGALHIEVVDYRHERQLVAECETPCVTYVPRRGSYLLRVREPWYAPPGASTEGTKRWATVVDIDGAQRVSIGRPKESETKHTVGIGLLLGGIAAVAAGTTLALSNATCGGGSDAGSPGNFPSDCLPLTAGIGVGVLGIGASIAGVVLLVAPAPLEVKMSGPDASAAQHRVAVRFSF